MVKKNLQRFNASLQGDMPLFQVETLLAAPDVVLHPQANEVYKVTLQCVRDSVEGYVLCVCNSSILLQMVPCSVSGTVSKGTSCVYVTLVECYKWSPAVCQGLCQRVRLVCM